MYKPKQETTFTVSQLHVINTVGDRYHVASYLPQFGLCRERINILQTPEHTARQLPEKMSNTLVHFLRSYTLVLARSLHDTVIPQLLAHVTV